MSTHRRGTETRSRMVGYIRNHIRDHGYAPTMSEIAAGVGLKAKSSAAYHLRQLEADRVIERDPVRARAIRILP